MALRTVEIKGVSGNARNRRKAIRAWKREGFLVRPYSARKVKPEVFGQFRLLVQERI